MGSKKEGGCSVKISLEAKKIIDETHELTGCSRINIIEEAIKSYCSETIKIIKASKNPEKRAEMLKLLKRLENEE